MVEGDGAAEGLLPPSRPSRQAPLSFALTGWSPQPHLFRGKNKRDFSNSL